jgi:porin
MKLLLPAVFLAWSLASGAFGQDESAGSGQSATDQRPRLLAYPGGPLEGLRTPGIDLKGSIALSYQGLTAGDGEKDWRGGGKADLWITLDGERLGLWDGFVVAIHPEVTFGDSANDTGAGVLTPPNTMLAFPTLGGSDTELSVVFSQSVDNTNFSFGKFNLLDIASKTPIAGGGGLETFMNVAIAAPISGVTPPYLLGAIGTVKTEPAIYTLMIYDPRNAQDSDVVSDPFSKGTTVSLSTTFPTKVAGRTTFFGVRGVYSSATGIDLDSLPNLALPGEAAEVLQLSGYHYLGLSFQHYLSEDAAVPGNGWGVFGDFGLSDGNPNPVGWHAILGVGGTGTQRSPLDRWGVAWFTYGLSDDLKDGLAVLGIDRRDETGIEAYYSAALTPWLRLTADAQWVRPTTVGKDDAVFLALRLQMLF